MAIDIQQIYDFCLAKTAVTADLPFDDDTLVFRVEQKIFCITSIKEWQSGSPTLTLKYSPLEIEKLRAFYEAVQPGYHMNKRHWNTIAFGKDLDSEKIFDLITVSYDLVVAKLPKGLQAEVLNLMEAINN